MKSLHAQHKDLADSFHQLKVLNGKGERINSIPPFYTKMKVNDLYPLQPISLDIMQVNLGYMCNQTCNHCHVDAGPDRKEIMTRQTMQHCLNVLDNSSFQTVDLTGGAPEMNPNFRWFVKEIAGRNKHLIVRCNLTIILANKKYYDLPEFFKKYNIEVLSSLPYYSAKKTDSQRGEGVFEKSIEALKILNSAGYGSEGSGLVLNLIYNPSGAFLPPPQATIEQDFKRQLKRKYDIDFNNLFTITNMPISRFLDFLLQSGNYEQYMEKLLNSFNPMAAENVMCRNMISVGWDGQIYDCDFNQMLDLPVENKGLRFISDFNEEKLLNRNIVVNQHCYGCTAGAGSSCGGTIA